ncbi:uncharacterized protein KY384_003524 [Bacidia gigantensis]|uniref:uncharacterized protein n=1 Tax=Bacidia gigantensis TaxID=2732470 RepID=UPI001D040FB4|nr:uncharacterized protein KY384_003524 [Bacidia gigantensis]KAG8531888.1 hypothetical protein KY384_003524 [Bacidia gigantensis]
MGTFGCLPREIRDEIYHMVLCGVYTLKIRKSGENSDNAGELAQSPHLALLFTSKQLHEEAIIVFYEASAFKLKVSLCATDNVQYPALTLTNCNLMTNICFQITTGSWKDFDEFLDEDKAQSKKVKTLMSLFTSNRTTRNKVVFSFVFRPETRRVIWDPSGPEVMSTLLQSLFMNWMSYTDLIVSESGFPQYYLRVLDNPSTVFLCYTPRHHQDSIFCAVLIDMATDRVSLGRLIVLPREIRDEIYSLVLVGTYRPETSKQYVPAACPGVLRVSKRVHREALPIFNRYGTFIIDTFLSQEMCGLPTFPPLPLPHVPEIPCIGGKHSVTLLIRPERLPPVGVNDNEPEIASVLQHFKAWIEQRVRYTVSVLNSVRDTTLHIEYIIENFTFWLWDWQLPPGLPPPHNIPQTLSLLHADIKDSFQGMIDSGEVTFELVAKKVRIDDADMPSFLRHCQKLFEMACAELSPHLGDFRLVELSAKGKEVQYQGRCAFHPRHHFVSINSGKQEQVYESDKA